MPRDKTENHGKIVDAAFREFLEYGFADASLRRIAAACEMSVSGLYKHFQGKEEMFAALVDPAIEGLMSLYREVQGNYDEALQKMDGEDPSINQNELIRLMEYIYEHYDEFKLIICKSGGTMYEDFAHRMAKIEEEATGRYMDDLRQMGVVVQSVDAKEFHLLVTSYIEAVFQPVVHDFSKKEALHYAQTLEKFYIPAWKALFGI
ncbi:MAG: TetR/AcrR family transcriptional regulator [Eubacterium sp.]|nr:TetR/AcrR family transcriptional regulator [Eubacterium sp.]